MEGGSEHKREPRKCQPAGEEERANFNVGIINQRVRYGSGKAASLCAEYVCAHRGAGLHAIFSGRMRTAMGRNYSR